MKMLLRLLDRGAARIAAAVAGAAPVAGAAASHLPEPLFPEPLYLFKAFLRPFEGLFEALKLFKAFLFKALLRPF